MTLSLAGAVLQRRETVDLKKLRHLFYLLSPARRDAPCTVCYIFPASVGVTPAVFIDLNCKSGSFCNPNLQI